MRRVSTQSRTDVITSTLQPVGIAAVDAHQIAGITYRQLDHWARQGWVLPTVDPGKTRSGRRQYAVEDVVRLDLLRHLAQARVNTSVAGPVVASFEVPGDDALVLWGPIGLGDPCLCTVERSGLVDFLTRGGAWVTYDPVPARVQAGRVLTQKRAVEGSEVSTTNAADPAVRSARIGISA